ncbi:MAG TPA: RNA 2',3'-cyclic phosphodiesterase [Candidatus Binatia bacterium]|jgi:2'-5' RNA ligase
MDRAPDDRARPIRSFVALEVEEPARAPIAAYLAELRPSAGVAWTRPENLHVTLKFLGGVLPARLEELAAALAEVARACAPFTIAYDGVGAFPSLARPATLWVGAEAPALVPLAREVGEASVRIGVAREVRPFHPHVTLGRVRSQREGSRRRPPRLSETLRAVLDGARTCFFGTAPAQSLVLFRSDTDPRGARYTPLGRFPLGG